MALSPFSWIRRKAAEAFVAGIADGAAALTPEGETPPSTPEELRQIFAATVAPKQLAAKATEDEEPARGKARK